MLFAQHRLAPPECLSLHLFRLLVLARIVRTTRTSSGTVRLYSKGQASLHDTQCDPPSPDICRFLEIEYEFGQHNSRIYTEHPDLRCQATSVSGDGSLTPGSGTFPAVALPENPEVGSQHGPSSEKRLQFLCAGEIEIRRSETGLWSLPVASLSRFLSVEAKGKGIYHGRFAREDR